MPLNKKKKNPILGILFSPPEGLKVPSTSFPKTAVASVGGEGQEQPGYLGKDGGGVEG